MNSHVFFLRRAFCSPWLYLVIGIGLLFLMLAAAPPASAQTAQPGATDPAANYSRWPDDEIYLRTPPLTDGSPYSKLYETGSTLSPLSLKESAAADPHDAIDAVAGHFLTPEHDSIAQAYRSGADLEVKFYGESTATHWLKDLAPRIAGCTDFFDLAAGELDRLPSGDVAAPDFRDEVVAVYAQPADDLGRLRLQLAVLDVRGATVGNPVTTTVTTAFTLAGPSASSHHLCKTLSTAQRGGGGDRRLRCQRPAGDRRCLCVCPGYAEHRPVPLHRGPETRHGRSDDLAHGRGQGFCQARSQLVPGKPVGCCG